MSLLGVVAAGVTGFFTSWNPSAMAFAYSVGSGVDAYNNQPDRMGPRLDDLRTQMSVYGNPIPFGYGCNRHAGTVIWPSILEAAKHETTESAKGGPEQHNFTYTLSLAVLVCEGPIAGIRRIWANKKLIYDVSVGNDGATMDPAIGQIRFYNGTETQEVDPLIEATDGASPAYLGYAYVVFEDYDVTEMNGRPPQFEFEVITVGNPSVGVPENLGAGGMTAVVTDPDTGEKTIHSVYGSSDYVYDPETGELLQTIGLPSVASSVTADDVGGLWIGYSESGAVNGNCASHLVREIDGSFTVELTTDFGYTGAISKLGTVVWNQARNGVYGFVNNGVGAGAKFQSAAGGSASDSLIVVPDWVYHSQEMPDIGLITVAGYGNWLAIIGAADDTTLHTVYNTDWASTIQGHRMVYDQSRGCVYWAVTEAGGVYKVDLTSGTLSLLIDIDPVEGLFYDTNADQILVDSVGDRLIYTPDGDLVSTGVGIGVLDGIERGVAIPFDENFYFASEAGVLWKMPLGGRLAPDRIQLSEIVTDLCLRAGLTESDINVSQLTDLVDGYIVPRQMTARAAIEPLQQAYYFDAVESDDKIKFVKRGSATTTTIAADDRAAHEPGQETPASVGVLRAFETELPIQCDVEYPDVAADHQIGNQYDRRITKDTRHRINLQLPIVMPASKAKQVARTTLYQAWQNNSFKWSTTRKYAHLEPTDIVALPTDSATYRARITNRRDQPNGIIEWEGMQESVEVYTQTGDDAATLSYVSQTVFEPATTVLELLDTPILRDQDKDKGFYIAMCGTTTNWPGAQVFRSEDEGSTYNSILVNSNKSVIGHATTVLASFTGGNIFDDGSSVTIQLTGGGTLVSYTEEQVLNGYGGFVLGNENRWEVGQYKNATLVAPNTYTLTGLLRGRRGTEWATSTHQVGDTFVLGSVDAWRLYSPPSGDLNTERLYKAPAYRALLSSAAAQEFTDRAVRRRPYSVSHLRADPLNDGGFTVSWMHRSLAGGDWSDGTDVALDGAFTTFSVTISRNDGSVVRDFTTTNEAFPYSASEVTADFGSIPTTFRIRVAQRNSDYGDGVGVTIKTDDQENPIYDFDQPFAPPYVPPNPETPPTPPGPGEEIPPAHQWFGPDFYAPVLWDGTRFIASNMFEKAIPADGPYWTSTNGLSYTQLASNNSPIPLSVAVHHAGTYINSWNLYGIWRSTDLQSWVKATINAYPSGYPYDASSAFAQFIHDGTRYIGIRENGEILASTDDGATWDHICNVTTPSDPLGNFAGNGMAATGIAYGNGVYVAVGDAPGSNAGAGSEAKRIWTSPTFDGPYTERAGDPTVPHPDLPVFDRTSFSSIEFCADDGYFYALGGKRYYVHGGYWVPTGVIIRSTDGVTWDDVSPALGLALDGVGSGGGRFFKLASKYVVIATNAYYLSDDGGAWTEHALQPYNRNQLYCGTSSPYGRTGASNGSIIATQEYQWNNIDYLQAGVIVNRTEYYRKPITFDGTTFDPTLDSPYP